MKKLLIICGPTATGKTRVALYLAKLFDGELVSADSRQVYRGMDIGTGKDLPEKSNLFFPISTLKKEGVGCYEIGGIKTWGYDLIEPTQDFSVAQYIRIAKKVITNIRQRGKLPIIIGGTGFYIKGLIDGIPTEVVPRNINLRKNLNQRSASELFEQLAEIDPIKAASLNISDSKNPRRLIRAIEVATWKINKGKSSYQISDFNHLFSSLFIGLTAERNALLEKIEKRVKLGIKKGFEKEVKTLLTDGVTWKNQAMNALGYSQWRNYLEGKLSREETIKKWIAEEHKYAKRQMTWFRRDKRINWFYINEKKYLKDIEKMVEKWYKNKVN